ncbi:MAG: phosphoglucosamine mutase, partial [Deferribacteraceae bacterium]|nr:phosphoglucosamine mutase [Deferribacteraceae bacterium]
KLPDDTEEEIERMIEEGAPLSSEHIGKAFRTETAVGRYAEFVKTTFDKDLDLRGLKVVIDCANGATYKVAPAAIEELGAEITVINDKPNGANINDNCGATAPEGMAEKVREIGADIGFSFDGDGDRLIACDSSGHIVDGDYILGICGSFMKEQGRLAKNTIVATVMSNQGFVNSMNRRGINVVRSKVGDRYVLECMKAGGYNVGGEQSGHIIFSEYISTGDGLISALQILKVMIGSGKPLDKLAEGIEIFPQVLKNIPAPKKIPLEDMPHTSKLIDSFSKKLGDTGRVLVRYSGTENKLRVMLEGENQDIIERYAQDIADQALKEL